jgi:hypothetical protein
MIKKNNIDTENDLGEFEETRWRQKADHREERAYAVKTPKFFEAVDPRSK